MFRSPGNIAMAVAQLSIHTGWAAARTLGDVDGLALLDAAHVQRVVAAVLLDHAELDLREGSDTFSTRLRQLQPATHQRGS